MVFLRSGTCSLFETSIFSKAGVADDMYVPGWFGSFSGNCSDTAEGIHSVL